MKLTNILLEAQITDAETLVGQIEKSIKSTFPKSFVKVVFQPKHFKPSIYIMFAVGKDTSQWPYKIEQNDISLTKAHIWGMEKDGKLNDKIQFEASQGGSILAKPEPGSHMAYSSVKVGLRKKTGTPEQILKHIDSYFKKLKETLKKNRDKIPEDHLKLIDKNF